MRDVAGPMCCDLSEGSVVLRTANQWLSPGAGERRAAIKSLPIYPGTVLAKANARTPMHGDYLTIFLNDIATTYVETLQGRGKSVEYVDFPN